MDDNEAKTTKITNLIATTAISYAYFAPLLIMKRSCSLNQKIFIKPINYNIISFQMLLMKEILVVKI